MSNYAEELEKTLKAFEGAESNNTPGRNDTREIVLDKETARSKYLFGILEGSLAVLEDPEDKKLQRNLIVNLINTLRHHTESGGAGSEALTRLISLDVIDEIPHINVSNGTQWIHPDKSDIMVDKQNGTISLMLYFNAYVPDEFGNETWINRIDEGEECYTDLIIKIDNKERIREFLHKLHQDYITLLKVKYPEDYVE